eukprot:COSAG01_NODE_10005_length_2276_cov_29.906293_3_plen_337_part_00
MHGDICAQAFDESLNSSKVIALFLSILAIFLHSYASHKKAIRKAQEELFGAMLADGESHGDSQERLRKRYAMVRDGALGFSVLAAPTGRQGGRLGGRLAGWTDSGWCSSDVPGPAAASCLPALMHRRNRFEGCRPARAGKTSRSTTPTSGASTKASCAWVSSCSSSAAARPPSLPPSLLSLCGPSRPPVCLSNGLTACPPPGDTTGGGSELGSELNPSAGGGGSLTAPAAEPMSVSKYSPLGLCMHVRCVCGALSAAPRAGPREGWALSPPAVAVITVLSACAPPPPRCPDMCHRAPPPSPPWLHSAGTGAGGDHGLDHQQEPTEIPLRFHIFAIL